MRLKPLPIILLSAVAVLAGCKAKQEEAAKPAAPQGATEEDKTWYALGAIVSQKLGLESFEFTAQELEQVKRGLADSASRKTLEVEPEKYGEKIQQLHDARVALVSKREAQAGEAFLDKAAAEPGAVKTESGIIITQITPGTGPNPKATDQVRVNYKGTLIDGKVFDASDKHGGPATFPLNRVIACWTEGVQHIKVGGKSRLVCPGNLAYGERGSPPDIKPGATLIFEIELLDIVK